MKIYGKNNSGNMAASGSGAARDAKSCNCSKFF
jgi:hypothetical protein